VAFSAVRYLVPVFHHAHTVTPPSKPLGDSSFAFRQSWLRPAWVMCHLRHTKRKPLKLSIKIFYSRKSMRGIKIRPVLTPCKRSNLKRPTDHVIHPLKIQKCKKRLNLGVFRMPSRDIVPVVYMELSESLGSPLSSLVRIPG